METYSDSNNILKPSSNMLCGSNYAKLHAKMLVTKTYTWPYSYNGKTTNWADRPYECKVRALRFALPSQVVMKMLKVYGDGNSHSYQDVCRALGFYEGRDIDSWRSLIDIGAIDFSYKGPRGRQFFKITGLGREVLSIVNANNAYYRIVRWFKMKGSEDDKIAAMMHADLNGEEAWKDMLPEAFIALLEALFNESSELHAIGSCWRWMNNIVSLMKNDASFFEKLDVPEVHAWLQSNAGNYYGIETFMSLMAKAKKKHAKKQAKMEAAA